MSVIDTIKSRPLLFGGVAAGGIALIVLMRMTSATDAAPGVGGQGDVGTGDAVQGLMIQAQRDISIAGISAQAQAGQTAAQLEATKLDYEYRTNAAEIGANVALAEINATLQALTTRDTLQTQVALGDQQTQRTLAEINANATIEQSRTLANALVAQSAQQAGVAMAAIAAQPKQGFLSRIFG